MPETIPVPSLPEERNIVSAFTLLDDWSSFVCRDGAAQYLRSNVDHLPRSEIGKLWTAIYEERSTPIVATYLKMLGDAKSYALLSAPLLIHHLYDRRPYIARVAAEALVSLAPELGAGIIPFLSAKLTGDASDIRREFRAHFRTHGGVDLDNASIWAESTTYVERREWLEWAHHEGCLSLGTDDWHRFLALMSHSDREHIWGCAAPILFHGAQRLSSIQASQLAACGSSFFGHVVEHAEPCSARFLAQTLLALRPFTASLAYPLSHIDLQSTSGAGIKVHGSALLLLPESPSLHSLNAIISLFWYQNDPQTRDFAIMIMENLATVLKGAGALGLIRGVKDYIEDPPVFDKSLTRRIARMICKLPKEDAQCATVEMASILRGDSPKDAKIVALTVLQSLHHDEESIRLSQRLAQSFLNSDDIGIATVAKTTLLRLKTLENSLNV